MSAKQTIESFWSKVDVKDINECWEWTQSLNNFGYGTVGWHGKVYTAHRIAAWSVGLVENISAPIDKQSHEFVLHICDNPKCCNPTHLEVGSFSKNQLDSYKRNRRKQPQSKHSNAKLTKTQVQFIRKNKGAMRQIDLAKQYNVSQRVISLVQRNESYKDIQ